ncbi:unnamed protein product, partial [Acidithrix sp. C25]
VAVEVGRAKPRQFTSPRANSASAAFLTLGQYHVLIFGRFNGRALGRFNTDLGTLCE